MFNRCFQLFGFPKDDCDWKIRKAKVQCCTEPTPVWNILKHWNHHESSGIVVIHQVASYELALRDRLKLRPEVAAVFFPPGRSWLLQVYGIQVRNPKCIERLVRCSVRHWEALPINVAEQYRSRVEQLSHVLENLLRMGGGRAGV